MIWNEKQHSDPLEPPAAASCITPQMSSAKLKWNCSQRWGRRCQKPKVPTPTCRESSCRGKLLVLTACVLTGSLSGGEAGQWQGAELYEPSSAALAAFPQALHWRTWLWLWSCCRPDHKGRAPCTNTCHMYVQDPDRRLVPYWSMLLFSYRSHDQQYA